MANSNISDIAIDELEVVPPLFTNNISNLIQITLMTGSKIIKPNNALTIIK